MENLLRSGYLCNPQQAYTLRKVTVAEGRARGAAGGINRDGDERANGTLPVLKPFESVRTEVSFSFRAI